ncbi:VirK/YbjX family protein [Gallibacterium trehalosifermentans]|uniref:VirK/YbjX family protein n=1 Tax=Gallibacterium trehalosifermentans TaxID=516935 RepID=A0ABV6H289_9PAST
MFSRQPFTHFPTVQEMYPFGQERRVLKQLRYVLRYFARRIITYKQGNDFIQFLNQHSLWLPLFQDHKHRFHTILYHYCDKRFSAAQRVLQLKNTFLAIETLLGEEKCEQLVELGTLKLADLGNGLALHLNVNQIDPFEGLFSLNIQDGTEQRYYDASFAIIDKNRLLIASIQGPSGENAAEIVKKLTKQLHGMRPMFMLVECFKWLAQHWQLQLIGIPHKAQTKIRLHGSKKIYMNYDEFWQENGGSYQQNYWFLPLLVERRPLEEIQSKKRSMYRKRYELFDQVMLGIQQHS